MQEETVQLNNGENNEWKETYEIAFSICLTAYTGKYVDQYMSWVGTSIYSPTTLYVRGEPMCVLQNSLLRHFLYTKCYVEEDIMCVFKKNKKSLIQLKVWEYKTFEVSVCWRHYFSLIAHVMVVLSGVLKIFYFIS